MRKLFIQKLVEFASSDPDIYLITGDLGFSVIEPFKEKFPDRFINAGISEQNMIGVAAGLALAGKKVFVYSIIPFVTMRCFEQIRVDLCYQNLPVYLVGVGAGFAYGAMGSTHHAIEDIAIMRALPNMTVVVPGSNFELSGLLEQVNQLSGPAYIRLSKNEEKILYPNSPARPECARSACIEGSAIGRRAEGPFDANIKLGQAIELIPSNKNLILASGDILSVALDVCKKLRDLGIDIGLFSVPTIKPLDFDFITSRCNSLDSVFTIEDHSIIGGLGEVLAMHICQNIEKKILFKAFALPDQYFHEIGSRDYLRNKVGLSESNIFSEILNVV
ncbi:MAG: transketolase C-terminal domain-containing protein [bacterium]